MTGLDKSYVAEARFGARSDTLDAEGKVEPLPDARMPDEREIRAATARFTGPILQVPPMASAVKVGGERLYKAHRRGEEIEREPRPVTVHTFDLLALEGDRATFGISCSSGTYVRSLVSDLAEGLGTAAYLTALRRTRVGRFDVAAAVPPEDLSPDTLLYRIIQSREVVGHLPAVEVGEGGRAAVCTGRALEGVDAPGGSFAVVCGDELLAVYRGSGGRGGRAVAEVVLCAG